jgi:class 3 adenylate cyclase
VSSSSHSHSQCSGDPVNTVSKLAEDLSSGGMLLITANVQQAVAQTPEYLALHSEPLTLRTNKDEFHCYKLTDPQQSTICNE